jgi:hypothetical protein
VVAQGLNNNRTSPPARENITEWTRIATNTLHAQMIRNAWRHAPYSWFRVVAGEEGEVNVEEVRAKEKGTSESDDDESSESDNDESGEEDNRGSTSTQTAADSLVSCRQLKI